MARNLKHRIEVVAPVTDPQSKRYLRDVLLDAYLRDNTKARELQPDGRYVPIGLGAPPFNSQEYFIGRHETDLLQACRTQDGHMNHKRKLVTLDLLSRCC